ncbi:MAG TPA: SDR family NAD(P)-dependent oxidoreductase [Solirubrobacteraceae bacterium]|nr:SDR family NAD(P)-dependent oxidoreductase [Solirubrobacteraceae bacterium]
MTMAAATRPQTHADLRPQVSKAGGQEPSLAGKTVLVTGASRGIGAACALRAATAGAARVIVLGRSLPELEQVAEQVIQAGAQSEQVQCDVTETACLRKAIRALGQIDVLISSAGANRPQPFLDVEEETYDWLFDLNVRATFFAAQAAARQMHEGGAIVLISSQMGHVGARLRSVYCATKHAIEGLTKALAVELAPEHIRVVSVAPTFVRTAMTAAQLDDPVVGPALLAQIPAGRFATVEDVAEAVLFAASPAASLMTGTSLIIDGGWTAQ